MTDCIPGSNDNRHNFSIVPVDVRGIDAVIFKTCSHCGTSYQYVDQPRPVWEEIATEMLLGYRTSSLG
ncbi:MAG: hypothetical protein O2921_11430 [Chloroflexi bacterium]|nr:hypothetical protein [Chloroflexota bacterium]MDA1283205.1 hypothetical protein [Chloroflexota bacterium]